MQSSKLVTDTALRTAEATTATVSAAAQDKPPPTTRAYEGLRGAPTPHTPSLAAPSSAQAETRPFHPVIRSAGRCEVPAALPCAGRSVARMARTADVDAAAVELLDAIDKGDSAAVGALLRTEAGRAAADVVCGEPETTPLLAAVKGEHTAIVSLLLEASADPDRVPSADPNGEPPGDSPLQHAAAEGYLVRTLYRPVVLRPWLPSSCRASSVDSHRMDCV